MIAVRKATERGYANHGWLESWHSFSFADYHDPAHVHFGSLRVINEDTVQAGYGFPTHGHRDMEILSYVLSGTLEHKDSMGNGTQMRHGDVQLMCAGTGVQHSEFNPSHEEATHFLQIWIMPAQQGLQPGYQQKKFTAEEKRGRWCLLVSADAAEGSLLIHQDARVYATLMVAGENLSHALQSGRKAYLHVVRGNVTLAGEHLQAGDAAMLSNEAGLQVEAVAEAELLLFELG
jgi:quercetin 2,3-dioxygenase